MNWQRKREEIERRRKKILERLDALQAWPTRKVLDEIEEEIKKLYIYFNEALQEDGGQAKYGDLYIYILELGNRLGYRRTLRELPFDQLPMDEWLIKYWAISTRTANKVTYGITLCIIKPEWVFELADAKLREALLKIPGLGQGGAEEIIRQRRSNYKRGG